MILIAAESLALRRGIEEAKEKTEVSAYFSVHCCIKKIFREEKESIYYFLFFYSSACRQIITLVSRLAGEREKKRSLVYLE